MKLELFFLTILNVFVLFEAKLEPLVASEDYTHNLIVDEERPKQCQLFWKLLNNEEIQFEVHCNTTGWVGVGLSTNGGMKGADIAIGWVKDNKAYIKDCYATDKVRPLADAQQDLILIEGAEIDGYTIIKYKRFFETCDSKEDMDIQVGTNFVIFAWNNEDPVTGNNDWKYHQTNRFSHTVILRDFKNESLNAQENLPDDTRTIDLRLNNFKVPKKDTYYHCQLFKIPPVEEKEHMIQFEMIVNPKNKLNVHHLLVFECEDNYEPEQFPYQHECGSVKIDQTVAAKCHVKMIVAWGIGGKYKYNFPLVAGYPFEPSEQNKYLLIEMHYDNPRLLDNIVDDSGVKLYLTKNLREHDLGLLTIGTGGNSLNLQIPPETDLISFPTICHPDCTKSNFPPDGITVVSAFLHTHLVGKTVTTSLVRDGVQIKKLFDNPNYDFEYQFIMDIEPTKVYPGDALITTCKYSSAGRDNFTFFGHSTQDEMCFNFMYYYPKLKTMSECLSVMPLPTLIQFYTSLIRDGLAPASLLPENAAQMDFRDYVAEYLKTNMTYDNQVIERFKQFFVSPHNKTYICGRQPLLNRPDYRPTSFIEEESRCKQITNTVTTTTRAIVITKPNNAFTNQIMTLNVIILIFISLTFIYY